MYRINIGVPFLSAFLAFFAIGQPVSAAFWDCLWGGSNEETAYTRPYYPGMGGVTLAQVTPPNMNLGAPPPAIPVQATPQTQATSIPQATIPTITSPTGLVGSVGRPATSSGDAALPQAPPGTEILYVLPSKEPGREECIDGVKAIPATAAIVVAPGTPGAIPVAVKTVTVRRPKVEHRWSFSPVRQKTETLVQVVDPRTNRVVRTYCREDESKSTLPWPHRREIVSYETVTAKVATPVSLPPGPPSGGVPNAPLYNNVPGNMSAPVRHGVQYPLWDAEPPIESGIHATVIVP